MTRSVMALALVVVVAGLAVTSGCGPDPKERIALLEAENQQLLDDLAAARNAEQQARDDGTFCEQELGNLRSENSSLMSQLASARSQPRMTQPAPQQIQPETPDGWKAVPGGAMIALDSEVLFRSGKAALRVDAQRALDEIARTVNSEYPTHDILVYGHTDSQPIKKSGWKDNWELSAQRALSVARYLQSRGVAATRLVAGGCGEYRPRVDKTGAVAQNRRVEVFVLNNVVRG